MDYVHSRPGPREDAGGPPGHPRSQRSNHLAPAPWSFWRAWRGVSSSRIFKLPRLDGVQTDRDNPHVGQVGAMAWIDDAAGLLANGKGERFRLALPRRTRDL